jgi:hypothetical protein
VRRSAPYSFSAAARVFCRSARDSLPTISEAVTCPYFSDAATRGVGHPGQPQIGGLPDQPASRLRLSSRERGRGAAGVGEAVQEPGAPVEFGEYGHDRGDRQQRSQLGPEFGDRGGCVLGRQRHDDQPAVLVEADRSGPAGQELLQLAERGVQFGVHPGQRRGRVELNVDQCAEFGLGAPATPRR